MSSINTNTKCDSVDGLEAETVFTNNYTKNGKESNSGDTEQLTDGENEEKPALGTDKDSNYVVTSYGVVQRTGGGKCDDGRETWTKKMDFLLSIIGFAVDLANVWRFPYLCYKNGGGAFLIPYFLMLIFGALPVFFMEVALGQFHRQGGVAVWKIAPIFKGIGIAECLIAFYVAFYYEVIIAWGVYYLGKSFIALGSTLPWTLCSHEFNTPACRVYESPRVGGTDNTTAFDNYTWVSTESPMSNVTASNCTADKTILSAAEYFELGVLGLQHSSGINSIGAPKWDITLCLVAVYVVLYFSLWRGVKSSGKVVWVTATMPYIILFILLCRGVFLPGAGKGIKYFLIPNMQRLTDISVWIAAATQIFYSVGAGFGVHIAYASYNKFNANCYRDCIATVFANSFASILSGFVIFSYLGYMANQENKSIEKVAEEGPSLVFIVYPRAIATLFGSTIWAILFFIMLFTLGIDSAMGGLEAVLTGVRDEFAPLVKRYKYGREFVTFLVILAAFLFALPNVTYGGIYLFHIWDTHAAGTSILFAVLCFNIAVSWVYGLGQFCDDIREMLGFTPNWYWRICWKLISPIFVGFIIISSIVFASPLKYKSYVQGEYEYPHWANVFGWSVGLSSMVVIPGYMIYQLIRLPGSFKERVAIGISPYWEHNDITSRKKVSRFQLKHWLSFGSEVTAPTPV